MGSYFLLAEILVGIELEPDAPFEPDYCGKCTRCLDACPTSCILPDRTIDAARCISYLTIELKGPTPPAQRAQAGEWVFGCDICQQVCPWNARFAEREGDPEFSEQAGRSRPDLVQELALTGEAFNRKFKGSPIKRAKRRGYLRNVVLALGRRLARGDRTGVPALIRTLHNDPDALVRLHAAWVLAQGGGEDGRKALNAAVDQEQDPAVLEEIHAALGKYPS
jgi:epoxyqueuosine reductase